MVGQQVLDLLRAKPGQKADEIAGALGASRSEINKLLYGPLKGKVKQDPSYRWSLVHEQPRSIQTAPSEEGACDANTDLAKLCRYYLACIGYDDAGISTFLTSKYGDPDYLETQALPVNSDDLADSETARRMLGRKRTERGRYGLFFGYPTNVSLVKSKKSEWKGFMVEPLLLFPIEQKADGRLTVDLGFPIINQKPFQRFTNAERDMVMNEIVQLKAELGLGGDDLRPELDEIAMRLQAVRPEWPWKEEINPEALSSERAPMSEINAEGIYNRAIIVMAEKSPFTQGLEKELRDLTKLSEETYAKTALGRWIQSDGAIAVSPSELTGPLLEVLPMNAEQRNAVAAALTRPITIITGPPGTGKSQVVTNLLVNAAWLGKRVLFASKNNKAVDVVETRVNALGPRPILLRVGGHSYQQQLAEHVLALMSATTTQHEKDEFEEAKAAHERLRSEHKQLAEDAGKVIELRNDVDRREQLAEEARQLLTADIFAKAPDYDINALDRAVGHLAQATELADREQANFLVRLLWPLFRNGKLNQLAEAAREVEDQLNAIGQSLPSEPQADSDVVTYYAAVQSSADRVQKLRTAAAYLTSLRALQRSKPLEEIAKAETELLKRIARHSEMLWKLWLRLQPSKLSSEERKRLGKYTAILKMVAEAGADGQLSQTAYKQYAQMLRQISHLLPCWAVTSLSARGRIPLEANNFDIVVFDEASQCDIASALPLLFRGKSVVIIGDQKQLSHISSLQRGQDQALLERFELMDDFPHWAYSHQSLFSLGATQVEGEDIVSLIDHHRCHAHIINFSNEEFYEERLRVATKYDRLKSPNREEPGVRWIDIKGRVIRPGTGGAQNATEARAVLDVIRDLVLIKGYKGSIGVVTPFRSQANAITQLVNGDETLAAALVQREFLADTVHKFQGDERDVIIFSPVVSTDTPHGAMAFLRSNGNLFNVAITRARAQLIVVGDLSACGRCDVGYLSRFAAYTASLKGRSNESIREEIQAIGPAYPVVDNPESVSDWERDFYVAAYAAGLRLMPQYPVEKYIVDFLLVDGDRKLAVEIDGERYHRNWTGELCRRDQIRNQRLYELGYDVQRFWVYEVRDDLDGCLIKLKNWTKMR